MITLISNFKVFEEGYKWWFVKLRHVVGPNELGNSCKYFFDPMNVARDTASQSCIFLRELPYLPMRDKAILPTLRCCISGYDHRIKEIFTTIS